MNIRLVLGIILLVGGGIATFVGGTDIDSQYGFQTFAVGALIGVAGLIITVFSMKKK